MKTLKPSYTETIQSPYPTVRSYESAFIKQWREGVSRATVEVLKRIAQVASSVVKSNKI